MIYIYMLPIIPPPQFSGFLMSYQKDLPFYLHVHICFIMNERKSEQAHIPHAPTLLENAVYNEWQFQALVTGNRTKKGI